MLHSQYIVSVFYYKAEFTSNLLTYNQALYIIQWGLFSITAFSHLPPFIVEVNTCVSFRTMCGLFSKEMSVWSLMKCLCADPAEYFWV